MIPETYRNQDWPRKVARAFRSLQSKTNYGALSDYADDTAAAAGGVAVGELYRTGSTIKVRVA